MCVRGESISDWGHYYADSSRQHYDEQVSLIREQIRARRTMVESEIFTLDGPQGTNKQQQFQNARSPKHAVPFFLFIRLFALLHRGRRISE